MTAIGEPGTDNSVPLDTSVPAYYCAQHNKYVLDLYCSDCDEVLCPMCFIEKHQGHQRRGIEEASIEFRAQIESSVANLLKVQTIFRECCQRLEQQKSKVLEKTVDLERVVISAQEEVKKLADECANSLLTMISDTKAEALKRITTQLDDNNFKLASLDNYVLYSQGISQKGSDVDVCRAGNGLKSRYAEIQQMQINDGSEPIPILKKVFERTELAAFLSMHEMSIIGTLEGFDNFISFVYVWLNFILNFFVNNKFDLLVFIAESTGITVLRLSSNGDLYYYYSNYMRLFCVISAFVHLNLMATKPFSPTGVALFFFFLIAPIYILWSVFVFR